MSEQPHHHDDDHANDRSRGDAGTGGPPGGGHRGDDTAPSESQPWGPAETGGAPDLVVRLDDVGDADDVDAGDAAGDGPRWEGGAASPPRPPSAKRVRPGFLAGVGIVAGVVLVGLVAAFFLVDAPMVGEPDDDAQEALEGLLEPGDDEPPREDADPAPEEDDADDEEGLGTLDPEERLEAPAPLDDGVVDLDEADSGGRFADVAGDASASVVAIGSADGEASGAGVWIDETLAVTNLHVVDDLIGAEGTWPREEPLEVPVTLPDGREATGLVARADPMIDLALVEFDDDEVDRLRDNGGVPEPLELVDPRAARPGDDVVVVGAPFGLAGSVSVGVLSGVDRTTGFAAAPAQTILLQTDAAVNPGNSGGPLLDADGRVLGVVSIRPDQAGGRAAQGMSFAIPSDEVAWTVAELAGDGVVKRPLLGVVGTSVDPGEGMDVIDVVEDGAAEAAGIREGYRVFAVDGTPVDSLPDLARSLRGHAPGDVVEVEVASPTSDERHTVDVELDAR